MASLASKIPSSKVYTTQNITDNDVMYDDALTNKADKTNTWLKADADACLSFFQAGINNRVLINSIDINCKFRINIISDTNLKTKTEEQ